MENKLVNGLIFKKPREGAPAFVKGAVSVKVDEFKKFLDENNNKGWCNIDMLLSKGSPEKPSRIYFKLNDWKPATETMETINQKIEQAPWTNKGQAIPDEPPTPDEQIKIENIPF